MVRRCVVVLLAALLAFKMAPAHAAPDFMPVEEVQAGMRGIAKTVVSGDKIEEFGIEVIGVMKQKGPSGDLILVRTFGDVIERTGGIAQGMSGSPVYINDRLVGAIAYGWGLTDHKTGMVTPIADMMKLWELPDTLREVKIKVPDVKEPPTKDAKNIKAETADKKTNSSEPVETEKTEKNLEQNKNERTTADNTQQENEELEDSTKSAGGTAEDEIVKEPGDVLKDESAKDETKDETTDETTDKKVSDETTADEKTEIDLQIFRDDDSQPKLLIPQTTTLMASGFSQQAMVFLKKELRPYGLTLEAGGSSTGNTEIAYHTPEPGSMVGVELIRGDVNLSSMGTVTYVEDGKILAFGHPFMKRGNVNYFLSKATIYTTLPGLENSFKIGSSGPAIGVVNQDRGAGIAGKLGVFPRIVPLRITVCDKTMGATNQLAAQLAHDEDITPILSAAAVFSAIEKTSDRVGSGTARVKFDIIAQGMPVDKLERENMFYTVGNISELAVTELFEAMAILAANQYNPVNIIDVKVDIEMEKDRRTASITSAKANKTTAKAGEDIDVSVKLKPYRQEPITRTVSFTVPKDQPAGSMMVSVRGGGVVSLNQLIKRISTETAAQESLAKLIMSSRPKPRTFEDAIKSLTERDRFNDIVLEILNMEVDATPEKPRNKEKTADKSVIPHNVDSNDAESEQRGSGKSDTTESMRKFNISTDYIIDSETQFVIEVVK